MAITLESILDGTYVESSEKSFALILLPDSPTQSIPLSPDFSLTLWLDKRNHSLCIQGSSLIQEQPTRDLSISQPWLTQVDGKYNVDISRLESEDSTQVSLWVSYELIKYVNES